MSAAQGLTAIFLVATTKWITTQKMKCSGSIVLDMLYSKQKPHLSGLGTRLSIEFPSKGTVPKTRIWDS